MQGEHGAVTHFELLGVPARFDLDLAAADSAFKELQKRLHPDRHAQATAAERELVEVHSARLNEAMGVLRSPLRRASYWMELKGIRVLEEDQRMLDPETMMEVMEVGEEIEAARTQAEIDGLTEQTARKIGESEALLADAISEEKWDVARVGIERLQMMSRLLQRCNDWRPP